MIARNRLVHWAAVGFLYLTLMYSAILHVYGPEATVHPGFFTWEPTDPVTKAQFPDYGILHGIPVDFVGIRNLWKMSTLWGDSRYYIIQSQNPDLSPPPLKYRFLVTSVAGSISSATGIHVARVFVGLNILCILLTAILFTVYLEKYLKFPPTLSVLGGVLFMTMVGTTRTTPFPSVDPASFLFAILMVIAAAMRNPLLFILFGVLGVATKESLATFGAVWLFTSLATWDKRLRTLLAALGISAVPLVAFSVIRVALGGSPLEANFGFNLAAGQIPPYYQRLLTVRGLADVLLKLFLSFSFMWCGLWNLKRNRFLFRASIVIPLTIAAAVLFSGQLIRTIGILFPVVIPMFLYFFVPKPREHPAPEGVPTS